MSDLKHIARYTDRVARSVIHDYVAYFNRVDDEFVKQYVPNDHAEEFLWQNIPRFSCPDPLLEKTYYFRWWTFRKHIKKTENGFLFSEFLPSVSWAGVDNAIVCASGFHLAEARWLADSSFAEEYLRFWYRAGAKNRHDYSSWLPLAALQVAQVTGKTDWLIKWLPDFVADAAEWEKGILAYGGNWVNRRENGLLYGYDFFDGGEISIGGHGFRPFINSSNCASLRAIAEIARLAGNTEIEEQFRQKAETMAKNVHELLWDDEQGFFVVHDEQGKPKAVRELYGYAPWYFGIAKEGYAENFRLLRDPDGFAAPYGPTVLEQRHPEFTINYTGHECQWNGPSWPFATSITLGAVENLLNDYHQTPLGKRDYYLLLHTYAASQCRRKENGETVPWIDENLNPYTGDWISRTRLICWENGGWCEGKGGYERGKDYNHSLFGNHIIGGLVGVRAEIGNRLTVHPLVEEKQWPWFCLEKISYHGHRLDIIWDQTGEKFGLASGLTVWLDGTAVAHSSSLGKLTVTVE